MIGLRLGSSDIVAHPSISASPERYIFLYPDILIPVCPAFPCYVNEAYPLEIVLYANVD
jgi:hypothetical protein